ncbi:MAG: polyphosphate polymerase domain-containing protein [Sphingobacteriaceae bacterium]|nr:polyphosphate polymerase domain-containing protein [Sphingobacteriaceae bacterium]
MEGVKLMNRTDTKFCFTAKHLNEILTELQDQYNCVEIESKRISTYQTVYYDTSEFKLYLQHHNGKLNRFKVRKRDYVDSNLSYLEIKQKNNKGRTIKVRIKTQSANLQDDKNSEFISHNLPFSPSQLLPVIRIDYGRITLVNKISMERVTIDLGLKFIKNGNTISMDDLVIAEVKQEKKNKSPFIQSMLKRRIFEGGISKYCMAIALTEPKIKANNFKEKINTLNKITKNDLTASSYRSVE